MSDRLLERSWASPLVGLMFRREWREQLLADTVPEGLSFLEVYPENYARRGGSQRQSLDDLAQRWPITSHGVHLSLGGDDPLNQTYLEEVGQFLEEYRIPWFSDHLGTSVHREEILHEILPVRLSSSEAKRIAQRAIEAQARVGRPLLIENAASYLVPQGSDLSEAEFTRQLLDQCDAGLLLDVNNLWVNSANHGFSVEDYLDRIPLDRIGEIHIGGFHIDRQSGLLIDSHTAAPTRPVWRLLETVLRQVGPKPVLFEWEDQYKSFDAIADQLNQVVALWRQVGTELGARSNNDQVVELHSSGPLADNTATDQLDADDPVTDNEAVVDSPAAGSGQSEFLDEIQTMLHDADDATDFGDRLATRWAQASPAGERNHALNQRGLRFYTRAARSRRRTMAQFVFKGVWSMLSEQEEAALRADFVRASAGKNYDWLQNTKTLYEVAEAAHQEGRISQRVIERLAHQWALFERELVRMSLTSASSPEAATINPTLDVRQYVTDPTSAPERVSRSCSAKACAVPPRTASPSSNESGTCSGDRAASSAVTDAAKSEAPAAAESPPTLVGYYLHPQTLRAHWVRLDPSRLAAMRIVHDDLTVEQAAQASGVDVSDVRQLLANLLDIGLLVAPTQ